MDIPLISFDKDKFKLIRAIPSLDTMKEFNQVAKVYTYGKYVIICFDRVHKQNLCLSKPLGYINFNGAYAACLARALIDAVKSITNIQTDEGVLVFAKEG